VFDVLGIFDLQILEHWLGELFSYEITKMTIAFTIAARLHRAWVRKDIREQVSHVTDAIDRVATVLAADIRDIRSDVGGLGARVTTLEKVNPLMGA